MIVITQKSKRQPNNTPSEKVIRIKHTHSPIDIGSPTAGVAALRLAESMLLISKDNITFATHDINDILEMAIDAHERASPIEDNAFHVYVANILRVLRIQGNSVRLPEARLSAPTKRTLPDGRD